LLKLKNLGVYCDVGAITTNDKEFKIKYRIKVNNGRIAKCNYEFEESINMVNLNYVVKAI
jgi:dTDP-4-amino-4,6-dideoxygalactose transaminase